MFRALSALLCLLTLAACRPPAPEPAGEVVARFGDTAITAAQVDERVLDLAPDERPKPGEDLDGWFEGLIREIAVEHRLRADADEARLAESEAIVAAERSAERQISVQLCVARRFPDLWTVTEPDLRQAYDANPETFAAPERRFALHLFLRSSPGRSSEECRRQAAALRDRVLRGESFKNLATTSSDSESRHRGGSIGWVVPGELPEGFERVIFALEEGVPSDPVSTRDGVHLFYVEQILPARELSFEEARPALRSRLVAERVEQALDQLERGAVLPPSAQVLDRAGFQAVVEAGDDDAVVLRLGDEVLDYGGLKRGLRQSLAQRPAGERPPATAELAWQRLEGLRRRELIARQCRADGDVSEEQLAARLEAWRQRAVLDLERQRRLIEVAGRDETRLRTFYEGNIGLFSTPPRWQVRRLSMPLDANARAVMARLEAAAARPGTNLAQLAAELGGEIEDLGWRSLDELRNLSPKLPKLIAPLEPGRLSPPFRTVNGLEIVEVSDRRSAEPQAFEDVRERAAAAYVRQYTREVYRELEDEILATAAFEIDPEGFQSLRAKGLPAPDVAVEQLEALLDEL